MDPVVGEAIGAAAAGGGDEVSTAVRLIVLLTAMTFLPAMVLLMTPFTRFVVVFALLRQALGLQQSPPNQVLVGLALVLSVVVMQPTLEQVHTDAIEPYMAGEMASDVAFEAAAKPMRRFMLANVQREELATAMKISRTPRPDTIDDLPISVVTTGFVLSELRQAFVIGVKVYIPFLVIDVIIASVLLGMGMMMLPPVVISLPFKLLVFVLMDGWSLLVTGLVAGFVQ